MMHDDHSSDPGLVGQSIGHYRIDKVLGGGGMGVVYQAHDTLLNRIVALKLLRPGLAGRPDYQQLLNEARAASALNNPHICTIYEIAEKEGRAYIAMEYLDGISIKQLRPNDGFPAETVVRYGMQIAEGLAHAHERGVIHRDLKSANIIVTKEGKAKILDFGLAQQLPVEGPENITRSMDSISSDSGFGGTIDYMAPEILRGQRADARSDIWALGIVLYEMATGKLPFRGKTGFELATAILREPPHAMPASLPASLRAIILRCLSKDPSQRYKQAAEVGAALEAIQSGVAAGPVTKFSAGRVVWLKWIVIIVAVAAVLIIAFNLRNWIGPFKGESARYRIDSLAVLPLDNLSGDPEQDYFADGMTDALITDLSTIGTIRVISRTSTMLFKDSKKSLPEIARDLRVNGIIEGSVVRSNNKVRINAQLIYAPTDAHIWAKSYERDLSNIVELQGEVARAIAEEIRATLAPEKEKGAISKRAVDPEVYQLYLKGRYYWNRRTADSLRKGMEFFMEAIRRDPGFALAYAAQADFYSLCGYNNMMPTMEACSKAKAAAQKALEIDDTIAEAHALLADISYVYEWNWAAAEKGFKHALELNPNYATGRQWYAGYLASVGRVDEALVQIKRAQELDPLSLIINAGVGLHLYDARRYDEAIEQLQKTIELEPNFVPAHAWLGMVYTKKSKYQEAILEFQTAMKILGDKPEDSEDIMALMGYTYAVSGNRKEALNILSALKEMAKQHYVSSEYIALVYAGLGDKDAAFEWIQKAIDERAGWVARLKIEPLIDNLRSDPRYKEMLRQIGLNE